MKTILHHILDLKLGNFNNTFYRLFLGLDRKAGLSDNKPLFCVSTIDTQNMSKLHNVRLAR